MARIGPIAGILIFGSFPALAPGDDALDVGIRAIARGHGVVIEAARTPGREASPTDPALTWKPAAEREYLAFLPIFEGAMKRYPPGLLKAAGIRRFVWCGGFAIGGVEPPAGGLFRFDEATIYLNVTVNKEAAGGRRFTIHHEVFHALDHRRNPSMEDATWESISGAAAYLRRRPSGVDDRPIFDLEPTNLGVFERRIGFMTTYARSEVSEDKAELFACMMSLPLFVESRMQVDPQVAAKVRRIEVFLKQACPTLPDGFWASPKRDG